MSFKRSATFIFLLLFSYATLADVPNGGEFLIGGVALSRPLVLRSDFATKDVIKRLFVRSRLSSPVSAARFVGLHPAVCQDYFHPEYISACREYVKGQMVTPPTPQLKNGEFCAVGLGFDSYGGPRFKDIILSKKVHFWENEFLEDYRGAMNRYAARLVAGNPEQYESVFSKDTIEQYVEWAKNGKGALNNPVLRNGEVVEWHHDVRSKRILGLSKSEHRINQTLPSKGHGSGTNIAGGGNLTWANKRPFGEIIGPTAARWGGIAGLDLVSSSLALSLSGCRDKNQYIANTGSIAAAWLAATLSESLMVYAFPLSAGATSQWVGRVAIGSGGPASWIATGIYFATRYLVLCGWDEYQLAQAAKVEQACKRAERDERILILTRNMAENTEKLLQIVTGVPQ